ncbi:MAG: hypothetical protein K1X67_14780 [Fimbriimonadaceae bacterium]|nr:hypothetical protein [Fimbriimonadaceae bacterium]
MPFDDLLFERLRAAKRPDLLALLGDLKMDPKKFVKATDEDLVGAISTELRSAAGHTVANVALRRDPHDFEYKQILVDVADKLAPGHFTWTGYKVSGPETELEIEDYILERISALIDERLAAMSAKDKARLQQQLEADLRQRGIPEHAIKAGLAAVTTGTITGIAVGPLVAGMLFKGFWVWLTGLTVGQVIAGGVLGGGAVGVLVAALFVAGGPSYSKTIPATVRLILIRRSQQALADMRKKK